MAQELVGMVVEFRDAGLVLESNKLSSTAEWKHGSDSVTCTPRIVILALSK